MNVRKVWCTVCNKLVEVAADETVHAAVLPLIGTAAGGAIGGGTRGRDGGILGALIGAGIGVLAHQILVPRIQAMLCPGCNCELS